MKRRGFLKNGAITIGLVGTPSLLLATSEGNDQKPSRISGADPEEIRSSKYLRRAQSNQFLPKPPKYANVAISPMPLAERISRKIVPQRGFCCLTPGGEALSSGNGAVNIEVAGNPFTEQIPFSHESLFTPRKKSLEAPNIANVFPQVRQMMLDGKYEEAIMIAYNEWRKTPITRGGFGGARFNMLLEFPKSKSVKDYLRTVDFESTEVKVHWTDEHGDWVRRIFTSRPDNVVVQWLTAPAGQSVNVRIKVSEGGGGGGRGGILQGGSRRVRQHSDGLQ